MRWIRSSLWLSTGAGLDSFAKHAHLRKSWLQLRQQLDNEKPFRSGARSFVTEALPAFLLPPAVFTGLFLSLWFYKCCMMVIFQNKIIYMPGLPPFSRNEKLSDYAKQCFPVVWRESRARCVDGTNIALCVGELGKQGELPGSTPERPRRTVIVYFQGNASSLPPRTPFLSDVLKLLNTRPVGSIPSCQAEFTIVGVSYRGFWTSKGRPSQHGIQLDAAAALDWIQQNYSASQDPLTIVLWGQSVGAGVATQAAAHYAALKGSGSQDDKQSFLRIGGLILETPFTSVRDMLVTIYPQRWLPYRYLGPFLRNWWDSKSALQQISKIAQLSHSRSSARPKILILQAGKDELVPTEHGIELEAFCKDHKFDVGRKTIPGALHTEVMTRAAGRAAIVKFIQDLCG
ncbi:MAG: hypothetical protein M1837_000694 [Sclerophora amabilis]|nr:MAG: hypothetical protein M1837_000694 [Sclerophora amabilis]